MVENSKADNNTMLHGAWSALGHGTFSKDYLARHLQSGKNMVMKHLNVVDLHEVLAIKLKIYFTMELVLGGNLESKILKS